MSLETDIFSVPFLVQSFFHFLFIATLMTIWFFSEKQHVKDASKSRFC